MIEIPDLDELSLHNYSASNNVTPEENHSEDESQQPPPPQQQQQQQDILSRFRLLPTFFYFHCC